MKNTDPTANPSFDCLTDGHLFLDWYGTGNFTIRAKPDPVPTNPVQAAWCIWCGTGVHNSDLDCENTPT